MKSLIVTISLVFSVAVKVYACEEMKTTEAIVEYVCNYSLVSNTQCQMWKRDMHQMRINNQIIIDSFISWDKNLEDQINMFAERTSEK